ncbi:MAG: MarR family transcriptional regulator [Clostridia bacterium]|nr:MarR family transcriptional regulator [Clostridia bacterium]
MMVLWEFGGMTEGELGKKVYLDSGTLTPLLKRLEKQGYITSVRPETNERKLFIELTAAGDALKDRAIEVPCEMDGCLKLDATERMQLKKLLDKAIIQTEV